MTAANRYGGGSMGDGLTSFSKATRLTIFQSYPGL